MERVNSVISMLNIPMNVDENTYIGDDGLPHCTKCHGLKVTKDIIQGFGMRMPVPCDCMRAERRKAEERDEYNRKMQMLDRIRSASLLGERYKSTTFEQTDLNINDGFIKAYNRCKKYCEVSADALKEGYGVYIYGESGVGKTHLTACMCNELINQYHQCLFTNFFEISKLIRAAWNRNTEADGIIKRICAIDFLFIDDLGTEKLQKNGEDNWLQEQVYDIINKRYNNKKPTIFSSNYSLNELINDRGMMQKTVDRINEMATAIIKLQGASYRAKNKPKDAPF